jgi:hypothetical protein
VPSVWLRHPLRFERARNLEVHNLGRPEGSAGRLAAAPARAAPGRSGALWWSRTWRTFEGKPSSYRGPHLVVRNTPKPLGRRTSSSSRKGRQHPYPRGWLRCALRSSILARNARSRGGGKGDHCLIPCSSVARGLWDTGGRLPQTRHLWSPSDRAPSPCRRTHDRDDRRPS